MQSRHRYPAQTLRHALDRVWRQCHHRPSLLKTQRPIRGLLGAPFRFARASRLTLSHKSGLHPKLRAEASHGEVESRMWALETDVMRERRSWRRFAGRVFAVFAASEAPRVAGEQGLKSAGGNSRPAASGSG